MDSTENAAAKPGCLDALVRAPGWILTEPSPGSFSLRTEGGESVASIAFGSLDIGDRREAAETIAHWLREHWRNEMNRRKSQTCDHEWRPAQSGHRHFWTRERLMICPKCDARRYEDEALIGGVSLCDRCGQVHRGDCPNAGAMRPARKETTK